MSLKELKEVCTLSYNHESVQPFSIQRSPTGVFSIMTKTSLQIIKPGFKFNPDLNLFNLMPSVLKCPQSMPTNKLPTDEQKIYDSADRLGRETLLLDLRFLPKLSNKDRNEVVQSRAVAWSSKGLLAYLSNYGGLKIYEQTQGENEWESILDVTNEYLTYLTQGKSFPLNTMKELESFLQDILLTSLCFYEEMLVVTTKSDKIVFFQVDSEPKLIRVASVSSLLQHHVIIITPISKSTNVDKFLVAGSMDGQICIYKVSHTGDVALQCCLWKDKDLLAVTAIEVSDLGQGFLVVASKGGHLVGFQLDSNLNCTNKAHEMIASMPISGLMKVNENSFIATILSGEIKSIDVSLKPFSLTPTEVQMDFSLPGCSLYGIIPSSNQAYIILVSFVTQTHDHLRTRQPLNVTLCRLASSNPIEQLLSSPRKSLSNSNDYAELLRYLGAKDPKLLQSYEQSIDLSQNIGFTKDFIFLIKLSVIIAGSRYTYFRLRSKAEADVSLKRMDRLCQILEIVRAFNILSCLNQKKECTPLEKLAGRCLRLSILQYVATKPATEQFLKMYDVFTPELMVLVQNSEKFALGEVEKCAVCDKSLEMDSLSCKDGHSGIRCSITKVQIDNLTPRTCLQCQRCIWNDTGELKKIVGDKEELLLCPLCDTSFENVF